MGIQARGQSVNIRVCDPVSLPYMKAEKVRVQLLALRNEMAHCYRTQIAAKQPNGMEKRGKCQDPLRLRQTSRKNPLENDCRYQSDERECLSHTREQFGSIIVRRGPRRSEIGVPIAGQRHTNEPRSQQQTRIQSTQQEHSGQKCNE